MNKKNETQICKLAGWEISVDTMNYITHKGDKYYYHPSLKRAIEDIIEEEGRSILLNKDYKTIKEALCQIDEKSLYIVKMLEDTLKKFPIKQV